MIGLQVVNSPSLSPPLSLSPCLTPSQPLPKAAASLSNHHTKITIFFLCILSSPAPETRGFISDGHWTRTPDGPSLQAGRPDAPLESGEVGLRAGCPVRRMESFSGGLAGGTLVSSRLFKERNTTKGETLEHLSPQNNNSETGTPFLVVVGVTGPRSRHQGPDGKSCWKNSWISTRQWGRTRRCVWIGAQVVSCTKEKVPYYCLASHE